MVKPEIERPVSIAVDTEYVYEGGLTVLIDGVPQSPEVTESAEFHVEPGVHEVTLRPPPTSLKTYLKFEQNFAAGSVTTFDYELPLCLIGEWVDSQAGHHYVTMVHWPEPTNPRCQWWIYGMEGEKVLRGHLLIPGCLPPDDPTAQQVVYEAPLGWQVRIRGETIFNMGSNLTCPE